MGCLCCWVPLSARGWVVGTSGMLFVECEADLYQCAAFDWKEGPLPNFTTVVSCLESFNLCNRAYSYADSISVLQARMFVQKAQMLPR